MSAAAPSPRMHELRVRIIFLNTGAAALALGALGVWGLWCLRHQQLHRAAPVLLGIAALGTLGIGLLNYFLSAGIDALGRDVQALEHAVRESREQARRGALELERSKEELAVMAGITATTPDAIVMTDAQGKIRIWNRAAERLFGWSREEIMDRSIYETLVPPEEASIQEAAEKMISSEVLDGETWRLSKAGDMLPVHLVFFAMRNSSDEVIGRVAIFRDLRAIRQLHQGLMQADKLSAVGQLAAGVAHEINNPLGIILGFSQAAAKRIPDSDPLSLPIKSIEREAQRCKQLVESLLTFSRQSNPRLEQLDLNETVADTLRIIEPQAKVKAIELVKELGALNPIWGDKNQLQQVIVNLCNNAIDAMPQGGRVTARTRYKSAQDRTDVVLEIEDSGMGMSKEIQNKIFDPFFTTKEVGKGTGLGLSLVHEIVQRHQGRIELRSTIGRGTTFIVSLPVHPPGSDASRVSGL